MPTVWSPGTRKWWQSPKCCEISQFLLKCYIHLLLQRGRGSNTHSDVAKSVRCHFCCCLTTITSLPPTPRALTTQLTDLAHFSTRTTSRCRRTSSSTGRSSTITSTWKALQEKQWKNGKSCGGWGLGWVSCPCVCPARYNAGCIPRHPLHSSRNRER